WQFPLKVDAGYFEFDSSKPSISTKVIPEASSFQPNRGTRKNPPASHSYVSTATIFASGPNGPSYCCPSSLQFPTNGSSRRYSGRGIVAAGETFLLCATLPVLTIVLLSDRHTYGADHDLIIDLSTSKNRKQSQGLRSSCALPLPVSNGTELCSCFMSHLPSIR